MTDRRRAFQFSSERRAAFSKEVRTQFLLQGRDQKDVERARMEAYRKLCASEGIQSKRIEEYDNVKSEASHELTKKLEEVDYDQSLTGNQKKKKKFALKRKFAATTVSERIEKSNKKYNAITAAENIGKTRLAKRESMIVAKKRSEEERMKRITARKAKNRLYAQRTKKGQPILASRIESLLEKVNKQK